MWISLKKDLFSLNKTIINYIHNLVEKGMYNLTVTAWFIYFSGYKYVCRSQCQWMDWYRDYQHCGVLMASVIWSLKFNDDWWVIISVFPISGLPKRKENKIHQNIPHRAMHDREGRNLKKIFKIFWFLLRNYNLSTHQTQNRWR